MNANQPHLIRARLCLFAVLKDFCSNQSIQHQPNFGDRVESDNNPCCGGRAVALPHPNENSEESSPSQFSRYRPALVIAASPELLGTMPITDLRLSNRASVLWYQL